MSKALVFGRCEFRPAERQLLVDGVPVALGARAFDLLKVLVERRDRVVTKNELLDQAWPGMVVEENNLSVQISTLRKALGAQAIATVTGRGYQFTLTTQTLAAPQAEAVAKADVAGRIVRRLAAIVFGEVLDWSRLLAQDAGAAIAAWRLVRADLIEASLPAAGGRLIELAAEGVWIEFSSAVDAVRWALELQQGLAEWRQQCDGQPSDEQALHMRLGISVDELIVDDGKPVGEGARWSALMLQSVAADAAIVVADPVPAFVQHRLALQLRALGAPVLPPNAVQPVKLYALQARADPAQAAGRHTPLAWAQQPSVAVLPFSTPSAETDYFGEGITEEIVSALSANRALLVISRNSTLRYRASTSGSAEIAAELGVRYLLTGSVRRQDRQLRISAELVDAPADRVLWAERFDGADEDLFAFQARIAASIAAAIDPRVQEAEIARVVHRPTENLSAYDCVLRGLAVQYSFRDTDLALAGEMFRRAIALDPHYAQAHAQLAWWHNLRFGERRDLELSEDDQAAERLSLRAIKLDPRDALALSVAGHIQSFVKKRLSVGMEMFDQALKLNPGCALAWSRSAITLGFLGQGEESAQRVRNAMRLSPFDPQAFTFLTTSGTAALVMGRYDEAVAWYAKAQRLNGRYRASRRLLAAALALGGELAEAQARATELMQMEPSFRVDVFGAWYPMTEPYLSRVLAGMRLAGLPG